MQQFCPTPDCRSFAMQQFCSASQQFCALALQQFCAAPNAAADSVTAARSSAPIAIIVFLLFIVFHLIEFGFRLNFGLALNARGSPDALNFVVKLIELPA
jgi:hypothetical protein